MADLRGCKGMSGECVRGGEGMSGEWVRGSRQRFARRL